MVQMNCWRRLLLNETKTREGLLSMKIEITMKLHFKNLNGTTVVLSYCHVPVTGLYYCESDRRLMQGDGVGLII